MSIPPPRPEREILAAIRQAANLVPGLVLFRLTQGGLVQRGSHTYRSGLSVNGASDLIGILSVRPAQNGPEYGHCDNIHPSHTEPIGRFVAIECKTARGRLESEQEHFLELVRSKGGFACVCRSVQEFLAAMDRAREGKSQ